MKTSELTGAALDWAVAKCKEIELINGRYNRLLVDGHMSKGQEMLAPWRPSTDWAQGGEIIEREGIEISCIHTTGWTPNSWDARHPQRIYAKGPTPLIAAMRCYVASKMGDEVDVPDELRGEIE